MTKNKFTYIYLEREMKNHRLPYGLAYYNLLEEKFEKAEKAWNRYFKRYKTAKTKRK